MGLADLQLWILALLVTGVACLYSAVGHAGASGYLAVMALFGISPGIMRPAALILNVLVASVATYRFRAEGHHRWRLFWPFAAGSIPFAFLGGLLAIPPGVYHAVLGVVLLVVAARMILKPEAEKDTLRSPPVAACVLIGAGIGLLSGLIGVGGGIFLSPIILIAGWAGVRTTAGTCAPFILVNSLSGLLGVSAGASRIPTGVGVLALAAVLGGVVGSGFGATRLPVRVLRAILVVVLLIASLKLLISAIAGI